MKQLLYHMFSGFYDIVDENFPEFIILYEAFVKKTSHYTTKVTTVMDTFMQRHNKIPYMIKINKLTHHEKLQLLRQDIMDIGLFFANLYYTLMFFNKNWLGANVSGFWLIGNVFMMVLVLHINAIFNSGWVGLDAWYLLTKLESFIMEKHINTHHHHRPYPLMLRHFVMETLQTIGMFEMIRSTGSYICDLYIVTMMCRLTCMTWLGTVVVPAFLIEHRYLQYSNLTVFPFNATQYMVKQYVSSHDSLISQGYDVPMKEYLNHNQLTCLQDYFVMKRLRKIE